MNIYIWSGRSVGNGEFCKQDFGPLLAQDLTPDEIFIQGSSYKMMYDYIQERHDISTMRQQFNEDGFIIFKPEIPEKVLKEAGDFTKLVFDTCTIAENAQTNTACRSFHLDRYVDIQSVKDLALNFHIRAMLAVLHQHEPYPFQTLNYPLTSLARTHSDYIHFAAHPLPLMSAAWVALVDVKPEAGPVFYHKGSHKLSFFNMQDMGLDKREEDGSLNYAKYQDIMTEAMKKFGNRHEAIIPRGHCLIWSANLVHGGPPANIEKTLRLSQVTHYFFHNSNYNWVPIKSDVINGHIRYYDKEKNLKKWDNDLDKNMRKSLSKFKNGDCTTFTKNNPHVISPCEMHSRPPQVMSKLFPHLSEKGNDVLM